MNAFRLLLRPTAVLGIVVMAAIASLGLLAIRKDLEDLRTISEDNILWSAAQMEVELLRFQRGLELYSSDRSEANLAELQRRLDILWSRINLIGEGRVGRMLRDYDVGFGTLDRFVAYLEAIDPLMLELEPGDVAGVGEVLKGSEVLHKDLRAYTLRVVRADTAAAAAVRERMRRSARTTALVGFPALVLSVAVLILLMRDSTRQREVAAMNRRQAEAAEAASRAKSRLLTMMSHELRNPLNGILGPLALLGQAGGDERHARLIDRAQQSGRTMVRMLRGLLDYGDIQDERLMLKREPFRPQVFAEEAAAALSDVPADRRPQVKLLIASGLPEFVWGDADRLLQIIVYLGEYMLQPSAPEGVKMCVSHDGQNLHVDLAFGDDKGEVGWKLDLLTGMAEGTQPFSTDALGPLIARGLLTAVQGMLSLPDDGEGRRIRISLPTEAVAYDKIRVFLDTRSSALATLYRAALRSERVSFVEPESDEPANIVLVDATSAAEYSRINELRARFHGALFVSIGTPAGPSQFDDVVEQPLDLARLRQSVLGRLAS